MALFGVIKGLYKQNTREDVRFLVNQGGTSSGKTYTIMQRLIVLSIQHPRCIITVAGQDLPNLKVGAMRDMETIVNGSETLNRWFSQNKSTYTWRGNNDSIIEFKSYSDAQDAKNGKRDYLFVNEANGVPYDVFWQLQIRTRKQVFIDYNPTARFWAHNSIIGCDDAALIISDHRANAFLSEKEHEKIETIEDKELWDVYARGLTGKISGLIFTNWDITDEMPPLDECKLRAWGLDWGYVNDPTALVELRLAHGELWVDEMIYETGMTNPEIAERCKSMRMSRATPIVADSAEPKSIAELNNLGLNVIGAVKGADSIINGIDILKRYRLHVTRHSAGLIEELSHYKWADTKDGVMKNKPVDKFNHAIDAMRYCATARLAAARRGNARAHTIKL